MVDALAAALPRDWPVVKNYFVDQHHCFGHRLRQSCRVVREKLLSLGSEDSVVAARISETGEARSLPSIYFPPLPVILSCRSRWPHHI